MFENNHTRRDFLKKLCKYTLTLGLTPTVAQLLSNELYSLPIRDVKHSKEIWHYQKLSDKKIQCFVCPLNCILNSGETCFCRTRTNYEGTLYSDAYCNPAIVQVDEVEKGPFYHFLPGIKTLSIGTAGCNVRCIFCQNWELSQKQPIYTKNMDVSLTNAVTITKSKECKAICYTYTEPVVFYEYMYEISVLARQNGLKNLVATAANINEKPLRDLCKVVDGFVISIKSFDQATYKKLSGINMEPVLKATKVIRNENNWLEIVYVVIPTLNDDIKGIKNLAVWIKDNLGESTPLHLARFFPAYKLQNLQRTPLKLLEDTRDECLLTGLKYVYLDNVPGHKANSTYCPKCNSVLIERVGFKVIKNNLNTSKCPQCLTHIEGIWS